MGGGGWVDRRKVEITRSPSTLCSAASIPAPVSSGGERWGPLKAFQQEVCDYKRVYLCICTGGFFFFFDIHAYRCIRADVCVNWQRR